MPEFTKLTSRSIRKLEPHIIYWSEAVELNLNLDINTELDILTSGCNRYIAKYAINYAILLDDQELVWDLCRNGASLEVKDSLHHNKNPLEIAIEYGRANIVETLIRYGAKTSHNKIPSSSLCSNPFRFFWA